MLEIVMDESIKRRSSELQVDDPAEMVVSDVPAYSVVGGNPARVIKQRFSERIIKEASNLCRKP
jgi:hypothetical protein